MRGFARDNKKAPSGIMHIQQFKLAYEQRHIETKAEPVVGKKKKGSVLTMYAKTPFFWDSHTHIFKQRISSGIARNVFNVCNG